MEPNILENKIAQWQGVSAWIQRAKKEEMKLRKEIVAALAPDEQAEGTVKSKTETSEVTIIRKLNRKVDERLLGDVLERLPEESKADLISFKPSLKLASYRKLNDFELNIFNEALIVTPATPTLKIKSIDS